MQYLKQLADPDQLVTLTGDAWAKRIIKAKQETDFIPAKPITVAQFIAERDAQQAENQEHYFLNRTR